MAIIYLQARDPVTGRTIGYRCQNRVVYEQRMGTTYINPSSARVGLGTARRNYQQYAWVAVDRNGIEIELGDAPQQRFTRVEVKALLEQEREACARLCESEEQIRTQAGQTHPEESPERDRCFAAARGAINCARAIRSERPPVEETLP